MNSLLNKTTKLNMYSPNNINTIVPYTQGDRILTILVGKIIADLPSKVDELFLLLEETSSEANYNGVNKLEAVKMALQKFTFNNKLTAMCSICNTSGILGHSCNCQNHLMREFSKPIVI